MISHPTFQLGPRIGAVASRAEIFLLVRNISVLTALKMSLYEVNLIGVPVLQDLFRVSFHDHGAEMTLEIRIDFYFLFLP